MVNTETEKDDTINDLRSRVIDLEEEINGTAVFLHVHGRSVSKHLAEWDRKSMGSKPTS